MLYTPTSVASALALEDRLARALYSARQTTRLLAECRQMDNDSAVETCLRTQGRQVARIAGYRASLARFQEETIRLEAIKA